jgi:lipoprotein NlpI
MSLLGGRLLIIAVALLAIAAPAGADGWADARLCEREVFGDRDIVFDDIDGDIEVAIYFCTRAIESGEISRPFLARTLRNRAIAFSFAGYGQQALADLDDSSALNPGDAKTLTYRGLAVEQAGDVFAALNHYREALNIDPNQALARAALEQWNWFPTSLVLWDAMYSKMRQSIDNSGLFSPEALRKYLLKQRSPEIDVLLRFHLRIDSPYTPLWLHLVGERDGLDVRRRVHQYATQSEFDHWPNPILRLYLGEIDFAAAARAASDTVNTRKQRIRLCELQFYHAELLWVRDVAQQSFSDQAEQELHKVGDHCSRQSRESAIAKSHLDWLARWTSLSHVRQE